MDAEASAAAALVGGPGVPGVPEAAGAAATRGRIQPGERRHLAAQVREAVSIAHQDLLLALQDLDLGVHQREPLGERDQLGVLLRDLRPVRTRGRDERRKLVREVGPLLLVATRFAASLPGQELDLGQLALQARDLPVEGRRELGRGARELGHPVRRQSSGIRIQPWRMA